MCQKVSYLRFEEQYLMFEEVLGKDGGVKVKHCNTKPRVT